MKSGDSFIAIHDRKWLSMGGKTLGLDEPIKPVAQLILAELAIY